ncbi:MAG TPA: DUF3619 family protein [Methylibium sp.]|nr:DUF3619 family protein [Methylibium sp.]
MIDRRHAPHDPATAEARYALRVAARLNEAGAALPAEISERLRFAREQALAKARAIQRETAAGAVSGGALSLRGGWWPRLAAALPILALAAGLALVQQDQREEQLRAAAEIDAALLADDLPPAAYTDPGFAEFLKTPDPVLQ